ncbi:MAG: hypothetical protein COA68_12070 [Oceanobacter sp.]|nr:MAG: hypothetical protein COA68_12070 [Oceanobacter sp.]
MSTPRFIEHLGREAPNLADLTGHHRPCLHLPLHAKPVAPLNVAALLRLPRVKPAVTDALRWLNDAKLYRRLASRLRAPRQPRPMGLTSADVDIMTTLGRYEDIEEAQVRGLANVFSVVELAKQRRRHILEPILNDALVVEDFAGISLPTPQSVRAGLRRYSAQFDASSFYDQFELSPEVAAFFAFRVRPGVFRRYTRLPMGFRPACSIAQAIMELLADVDVAGVQAFVYIDNVLFTGDDRDSVLEAGRRFRERGLQCNVTLNDPTVPLADLVDATVFDFLGAEYDAVASTVRNTTKTEAKLRTALDVLSAPRPPTLRQLAAVFGLLFWGQQITPLRLAPYFSALRAFRLLPLEASQAHWNAPAPPLSPVAHLQLRQWLLLAATRPSRPLIDPPVPTPEFRMWVDASAFGWGAVVERTEDSSILRVGRPWSAEDRLVYNIASSVVAEPLGMRRAIAAIATTATRAIEVHTDHEPLVCAWRAGRGRVATYNDCLLAVQAAFPELRVDVQFVAGIANGGADAISRGLG